MAFKASCTKQYEIHYRFKNQENENFYGKYPTLKDAEHKMRIRTAKGGDLEFCEVKIAEVERSIKWYSF